MWTLPSAADKRRVTAGSVLPPASGKGVHAAECVSSATLPRARLNRPARGPANRSQAPTRPEPCTGLALRPRHTSGARRRQAASRRPGPRDTLGRRVMWGVSLSPANLSQTAPAVTAVSTHAGAEQRRLVQVARAGLGAASEACVGSAAAWRRELTLPAPGLGPSLQPGFLSLLPSFQTPHARTPPFF